MCVREVCVCVRGVFVSEGAHRGVCVSEVSVCVRVLIGGGCVCERGVCV